MPLEFLHATEIKENFRVDPSEYQEYIIPGQDVSAEDIRILEDKVYKARLRNSHKSYPRESYQNIRTSLYISIKDHWVLTPVELDKEKGIICDGLHRIAIAHSLYTHRPIPVIYKDYF